jgi:hypothetical protein
MNYTKTGDELKCPERVNSSCPACVTRVDHVQNPVISHERENNDRTVPITSEAYPWSSSKTKNNIYRHASGNIPFVTVFVYCPKLI